MAMWLNGLSTVWYWDYPCKRICVGEQATRTHLNDPASGDTVILSVCHEDVGAHERPGIAHYDDLAW